MSTHKIGCLVILGLLSLSPFIAVAGVDENSVFLSAQTPLSLLDLDLYKVQIEWEKRYVLSPDAETRKKVPLITKSGMAVDLGYFGDDQINAVGLVTNLKGFLALSEEERKKLVFNTLELLKAHLFFALLGRVDKGTVGGLAKDQKVEDRDIKLSVIIVDVIENDKNENIRLSLPAEHGIGLAGFNNGEFVYSEPYFLKLIVRNGRAVAGDRTRFVIEQKK